LARWSFFANRSEFRTGDYAEIMNKVNCLSLLSNTVVVEYHSHHENRRAATRRGRDHGGSGSRANLTAQKRFDKITMEQKYHPYHQEASIKPCLSSQ